MMIEGVRAGWRGLRHLNHRGYIYIWANLLWFGLSLPLVTAPAAWAGLVRLSYVAHTRPSVRLDDFWEGFRDNLRRGLVVFGLNVLIVGVNVTNLLAYQEQPGLLAAALRWVWLLILLVWFALQFFMWPMFYEMRQPTLLGALRNAGVMLLLNPFFALGVGLVTALLILLSTVLVAAWALLTGGALAAIATGAVLNRLQRAGLRAEALSDGLDAPMTGVD